MNKALELAKTGLVEQGHAMLRDELKSISTLPEEIQVHRLQMIQSVFKSYPARVSTYRPHGIHTDKSVGPLDAANMSDGISLVTCCMDRNENLRQALSSWLELDAIKEIIIIDWSSADPVYAFLKYYNLLDSRITVARVNDQERWILSQAYNLAFRLSNCKKILKIDCDIVLSKNFFEKNVLYDNSYMAGNHRKVSSRDQIYINGAFFTHKSFLAAVNGFNEYIVTYGWEDDDFYERLTKANLDRQDIDHTTLSHIPHPDYSRLNNGTVDITCADDFLKQDPQFQTIRNRYITRAMPKWGRDQTLQDFRITYAAKGYFEIEQAGQNRTELPDHVEIDADFYSKLDMLHRRKNISAHQLPKHKTNLLFRNRQFEDITLFDIELLALDETIDVSWEKRSLIVCLEDQIPKPNESDFLRWAAHLSISLQCSVFVENSSNLSVNIQDIYQADIRLLPKGLWSMVLPEISFNDIPDLEQLLSLHKACRIKLGAKHLKAIMDKTASHTYSKDKTAEIMKSRQAVENPEAFYKVEVTGINISVPDTYVSQNEFSLDLEKTKSNVLPFLATRVFAEDPLFIENFSQSHVCAMMLALLYSNKPVIAVCCSDKELEFVKKVSRINDINNLYAYNHQQHENLPYINKHDLNKFFQDNAICFNECVFVCRDFEKGPLYKFAQFVQNATTPVSIFSEDKYGSEIVNETSSNKHENFHFSVSGSPWKMRDFRHGHLNNRTPGLDIVVAMYNTPEYIIPCVESLLCKDREDINIFVIDDGSTDNSPSIVRSRFADHPQVKVFTKHNGGCASARNYGRLMSNSSHITFVDADDFTDPDFFAYLYDLARYTGCEMVQGGFDFFHMEKDPSIVPSYEDDTFKSYTGEDFNGHRAIRVKSDLLIYGQPTIWRRVYRRDFLDAKNIYFPENIRAFDDYIFHILSLYYSRDVYMLPDIKLHYRQHPLQDIKQGDERHFYEIYMFKLILRRAVEEGWPDFHIFIRSMFNSINWSLSSLRPDLIGPFAEGAAEFCVILEKVFGSSIFNACALSYIESKEFHKAHTRLHDEFSAAGHSYVWAYIENINNHPAMLQMAKFLTSE